MKKIDPPLVDDINELSDLSLNARLKENDILSRNINNLLAHYLQYEAYAGNPWEVNSLNLEGNLASKLKLLYENPPKYQLGFIKEYRDKLSPDICPMCGGLGKGTLDHYLPKDDYPSFAVLSKNLVPACDCNSKRNTTVKGDREPERVIHPYYDTFIKHRVFKAKFSGTFESPQISMIIIDDYHEQKKVLNFHLNEVVLNNKILDWLEKRWGAMFNKPHKLLRSYLPRGMVVRSDVETAIQDKLEDSDEEYDTPNNWWSFFYAGLLDCNVRLDCITSKINQLRL